MRNREFLLSEIAPKDKELEDCLLYLGEYATILVTGDSVIANPDAEIIKK
jgi:hypothetical protein